MADQGATVFLQEIAKQMIAITDGDIELATILSENFIHDQPHKEAVTLAKTAMISLAKKRAEMPEGDSNV